MVGGFDWNLIYKWKDIPKWEKDRLKNPCEPIRTPTMQVFYCEMLIFKSKKCFSQAWSFFLYPKGLL